MIKEGEEFDAFIIAPSWVPEQIFVNTDAKIEMMTKSTFTTSFKVWNGGKKLAWIQCASGAGNVIDTALCLATSPVNTVIFVE